MAVGSYLREQVIHCALLDDLHLIVMQRGKCITDSAHQLRLSRQRLGKVESVTPGSRVIQALKRMGEPVFIQIKGQISKAALYRRITVMDLPGLK
ncbi:Uncharacterised protein [Enterobacter cloacae]|nr:Uncharacterised protein [Enterobacter cloacae]